MHILRRLRAAAGALGAVAALSMVGAAVVPASSLAATTPNAAPLTTAWGVWQDCGASYPGQNCASVQVTADNPTSRVLFLGGTFTKAFDPSTNRSVSYQNLVAVDDRTGNPVTTFRPHTFNGMIYAAAVDMAANLVYVGGDFTAVDGSSLAAGHVAAFDMTTGALASAFNVQANGSVRCLIYDGGTGLLYVGGRFTSVQAQPRARLAAVNPVSGTLSSSFVPPAMSWTETSLAYLGDVRALTIGADATGRRMLYVGGHFDNVGGLQRLSLVRVDAYTGALDTSFAPTLDASPGDDLQAVDKIIWLDGTQDGRTGMVVGQAGHLNRAYRFDAAGKRVWTLKPDGDVQTAALYGSVVYVGGHFRCVAGGDSASSCYSRTGTFADRVHLAAVNVTTGGVLPGFAPQMNPKTQPYYFGVWNLRVTSGGTLWAAGAFKAVTYGGSTWNRPKLAAFQV